MSETHELAARPIAADVAAACIAVLHQSETPAPELVACATALASTIRARVVVLRLRKSRRPRHSSEIAGDLTAGIERAAELKQPIMIMISAHELSMAKAAVSSRPAVPVLVWRGSGRCTRILAASDLQHPRFPVLRGGNDLAAWTQAPLLVLHNVSDSIAVAFPPTDHSISFAMEDALRAGNGALTSALRSLEISARGVVSYHRSTAAFIADTARKELADLIVVGRRARPLWKRALSRDVADELLRAAEFSLLIIPM